MDKPPSPEPQQTRVRVVRRETKRYACGCSTTRIEVFSQAEEPAGGCQAHHAALIRETVDIEYEQSH